MRTAAALDRCAAWRATSRGLYRAAFAASARLGEPLAEALRRGGISTAEPLAGQRGVLSGLVFSGTDESRPWWSSGSSTMHDSSLDREPVVEVYAPLAQMAAAQT